MDTRLIGFDDMEEAGTAVVRGLQAAGVQDIVTIVGDYQSDIIGVYDTTTGNLFENGAEAIVKLVGSQPVVDRWETALLTVAQEVANSTGLVVAVSVEHRTIGLQGAICSPEGQAVLLG